MTGERGGESSGTKAVGRNGGRGRALCQNRVVLERLLPDADVRRIPEVRAGADGEVSGTPWTCWPVRGARANAGDSTIGQPLVIRKILTHLGLPTGGAGTAAPAARTEGLAGGNPVR